jgi:hypothetical protein
MMSSLLNRASLWRWPGPHALLLAAASGHALVGVSVYDAAGALRRTLRFSRAAIGTAFYRPLGPISRGPGSAGSVEAALAALLESASTGGGDWRDEGRGRENDGISNGAAAAAAAAMAGHKGGGEGARDDVDPAARAAAEAAAAEEAAARGAGLLALECLELEGGQLGESGGNWRGGYMKGWPCYAV